MIEERVLCDYAMVEVVVCYLKKLSKCLLF